MKMESSDSYNTSKILQWPRNIQTGHDHNQTYHENITSVSAGGNKSAKEEDQKNAKTGLPYMKSLPETIRKI